MGYDKLLFREQYIVIKKKKSLDRNVELIQFACLPDGSVMVKTQSFGFNDHLLFPFA